jgi:hypothetical protein
MSSQSKYDEILFAKERVAEVLVQTESEIADLERKLSAAEKERTEADASALLGQPNGSNRKAPAIPALSEEIKRKRGVLVALQARQRALSRDLRQAIIEKNKVEIIEWNRKCRELFEREKELDVELARVKRERAAAIGRSDALTRESSKLRVELDREVVR